MKNAMYLNSDLVRYARIKMKNAIYLNSDLVRYAKDNVDALLKKLNVLIQNSGGVLSGDAIHFEILYYLGIDYEKEVMNAFGIKHLKTKIYGIKSAELYNDAFDDAFLLFKGDIIVEEDNRTNNLAAALANAYEELNSLQEKTGVEMQISIGFTGVKVKSLKDNTVLSTFISKSELDKVADITAPLSNAIDNSIKKIIK